MGAGGTGSSARDVPRLSRRVLGAATHRSAAAASAEQQAKGAATALVVVGGRCDIVKPRGDGEE